MYRTLIISILEIAIGALLIYLFDLRIFLLYFLALYLLRSYNTTNFLRKIIRVYHTGDEAELRAILNKLEISETEVKRILKQRQSHMYRQERESLERDMRDISRRS